MLQRSPRQRRAATMLLSDLMLAPMVVWMRLPLMATEVAPDGGHGAEATRATVEKATAFADGLVAAQMSWWASSMRFWPEFCSGRMPSILSGVAAERSLHAALEPAGRRVRANYKRLARRG